MFIKNETVRQWALVVQLPISGSFINYFSYDLHSSKDIIAADGFVVNRHGEKLTLQLFCDCTLHLLAAPYLRQVCSAGR